MLVIDAGCVVSPLVLRIPEGAPIAVQNNDSVPHAIAFEGDADAKFLFGVPAGLSLDFNPSAFGKRAGIYRYRCAAGAEEKNAGVLYITE